MSVTYPSQRVAILVDVQNMFYSAYDCFRGRLNYKRLLDAAAGGRQVVRAIAYAMRDGNNQGSFFTMLHEVGFELRTKEPRVRPDGTRKGAWDIGITIDALMLAPKVDVVVLVSGDGDFVEVVHALRTLGVRVEVYAFDRSTGRGLREEADLFVPIGEDMILREARAETPERPPAEPPQARRQPERSPRLSSFGAGILDDVDDDDAGGDEHQDDEESATDAARPRASRSFLDDLEEEL